MQFTFPEAGFQVNLFELSTKFSLKSSFREGFMNQLRKF